MKPKWQKLASLAQEICTLWFQSFGAVFASKGYPFKNILVDVFKVRLHTEYQGSMLSGFRQEDFFMISLCKPMIKL